MSMRLIMLVGAIVTGASHAADIAGDWRIEASLGETPIVVNCTLIQSGDELSGSCTPVMADAEAAELSGNIDESTANWAYDVVFNGNPGHVAYEGEIESDFAMSGTLDLSGTPLQFTAVKQESE